MVLITFSRRPFDEIVMDGNFFAEHDALNIAEDAEAKS
jgi:hypothetical protein